MPSIINQEKKTGFVMLDDKGNIKCTSDSFETEDNGTSNTSNQNITTLDLEKLINGGEFYKKISQNIEQIIQTNINKNKKVADFKSNTIIIILLILLGVNTTFLFFGKTGLNEDTLKNAVSYINNNESKPSTPNIQNSRSINEFTGNTAITEIGAKISVSKNKISTNGNTNCKTPILPPEANGCDFVLAPSLLGLPKNGIILTSIKLFGNIGGKSIIRIDEKNYEKGILQKEVGSIESADIEKNISLPPALDSTRALYFRLWEKDGPVTIEKIVIKYLYVENLIPVTGKISGLNKNVVQTANVYLDVNENGFWDENTDKILKCSQFFPGIQTIKFNPEGKFEILRDGSCYNNSKPDAWFTDDNKNALHPGKWIMVFPNTKKSIPFEIQTDQKLANLELELK